MQGRPKMKAFPAALLFISLFLCLSIQRSEGDARSQMLEIILQHAGGAQRLRLRTQLPANHGQHQQPAPELPPRRLPSGHGAGRELRPSSVLRRPLHPRLNSLLRPGPDPAPQMLSGHQRPDLPGRLLHVCRELQLLPGVL